MQRLLLAALLLLLVTAVLLFGGGLWHAWEPPLRSPETPPPGVALEEAAAERGRRVFEREACWECHTRLGRDPDHHRDWWLLEPIPKLPPPGWRPNSLDRRRMGPDLGHEGGRRTDGWQYAHLFDPRQVDPASPMPRFPQLFETDAEGALRPTDEARDLVRYLQSLGEAPSVEPIPLPAELSMPGSLLAELESWHASLEERVEDEEGVEQLVRDDEAFEAAWAAFLARNGQPDLEPVRYTFGPNVRVNPEGLVALVEERDAEGQLRWPGLARGRETYTLDCAGCHGPTGLGDGPAADLMQIAGVHEENLPRNFSFAAYKKRSTAAGHLPLDGDLYTSITQGLDGSAMPSFALLPAVRRWELVAYLKTLSVYWDELDETLIWYWDVREATPLEVPPRPEDLGQNLRPGRILYERLDCAACHGPVTGDGRVLGRHRSASRSAWEDEMGRPVPWSRSFTEGRYRTGSRPEDVFRVLKGGLNVGPMPAYSETMTDAEIWDLVAFLLSLSRRASAD